MPDRYHTYFAEAFALRGHLHLPFEQKFCAPASVKLNPEGGYISQHTDNYRLGGVMSFRSAYTQVAGNREIKTDKGWKTLSTAVIEDFNVMEVVTADRIVAQMATDHPLEGYVPSVTFLGTRFENLRIAGHEVKLDINPDILGPKPAKDQPYVNDRDFRGRVIEQYERIRSHKNLPDALRARYNQVPSKSEKRESIECSLVNQAEGSYPGRSFGHIIDVPHFGKIYLATLEVKESDLNKKTGYPETTTISLTMIKVDMGCLGNGDGSGGGLINNGGTKP